MISTIMRPSTVILISWPGPEKVFLGLHITEKLVFLCVCGLAYGGEIGFLGSDHVTQGQGQGYMYRKNTEGP